MLRFLFCAYKTESLERMGGWHDMIGYGKDADDATRKLAEELGGKIGPTGRVIYTPEVNYSCDVKSATVVPSY